MLHLGRSYIEVGQPTETMLQMHDVRLIAVNDGVDSDKGEGDFTPFRNIMNDSSLGMLHSEIALPTPS